MKVYSQHIRTEEGRSGLYPFDYIDYYCANIQGYMEFEDGRRMYDGITINEFKRKYNDGFMTLEDIQSVLSDKRLDELQAKLEAEGKQVCMFNLYILCMYLIMKARTRYVILLKPTIEDLLAKEITSITINYKDGSKIESATLAKDIRDLMEKPKQTSYEVEKIVTWDKVSNKILVNSFFVSDLSEFLHNYFPVKRKMNAKVSTTEVALILYMMKLLGLVPAEPTNKRFWQLKKYYEDVYKPFYSDVSVVRVEGKELLMQLCYIPYKIWSSGKIDWDNLPELELKEGDTIQFCSTIG